MLIDLLIEMILRLTLIHYLERVLGNNLIKRIIAATAIELTARRIWSRITKPTIDAHDPHNKENSDDNAQLLLAASKGDTEAVKKLLEQGADANVKDGDGNTPILIASEKGYTKIVALLIEAKANAKVENNFGFSPITLAIKNNHEKIVDLLLDAGIDVNGKDSFGSSPIFMAISSSNEEMTGLVIGRGANINMKNDAGITPIIMTIMLPFIAKNLKENLEIVRHVSSNPNSREIAKMVVDSNINTDPIIDYLFNISIRLLELLLASEANPNEETELGYAITFAAKLGYKEMVELLLQYGANPDVKDKNGNSPLSAAKEAGHEEIVKLLQKALEKRAQGGCVSGQGCKSLSPDKQKPTTTQTGRKLLSLPETDEPIIDTSQVPLTQTSAASSFSPTLTSMFGWASGLINLIGYTSEKAQLPKSVPTIDQPQNPCKAEITAGAETASNLALLTVGLHLFRKVLGWNTTDEYDEFEEEDVVVPTPEDQIMQTISSTRSYLYDCAAKLRGYHQLYNVTDEQVSTIKGLQFATEEHLITLQEIESEDDAYVSGEKLEYLNKDLECFKIEFADLEEWIYEPFSYSTITQPMASTTTDSFHGLRFFHNITVLDATTVKYLPEPTPLTQIGIT